jgi:hypothetical protein
MAVYSMFPINYDDIRSFQLFLWEDMPDAMLPVNPDGTSYYDTGDLAIFRLSSKSHWDVPVQIDGKTVHFLTSHPTPPVFDGPEDRNGTRNNDEIRFWADYVIPSRSGYIYDDNDISGGITPGDAFVIAGDQNSDPFDGDSVPGSIQQLLEHPLVNTKVTPYSAGGPEQSVLQGNANTLHVGDPAFDTADFFDGFPPAPFGGAPGNLRADYVLPRKQLQITDAGVFWPLDDDPLFPLVGTFPFPSSDHRLVWVDVRVPSRGFLTDEAPFITLDADVPADSSVKAIINSGEMVNGFTFEGLPDGIGLAPGEDKGTVNVFVAHEQTTVPFFGTADFQDASVSKLTLDTSKGNSMGAVLAAEVAIGPENGYLRFCSASMAGPAEGFSHYTFFANEEANDVVVVPSGAPYGPDPYWGSDRQAGYVVVLDAETGDFTQVAGMGRLNHENTIALPGWNQLAMLTTDDTFSGPSAQLYLYLADNESQVWGDEGSLWAFRVTGTDDGPVDPTDPFNGANDYLDLRPGDDWQGEFIPVPQDIARGLTGVAPQQALEDWSNDNNVFQFIRLEDLAYDKNNPRVVYVADTGRTRVIPDPTTGRMTRGPGGTTGQADNGSVFKFVFNEEDPRKVDSFSVLAQGDDPVYGDFVGFVNPDNMGTSPNSLMVQEDADDAKIWRYNLRNRKWSVVATVNDPDGESSGIVDASAWFGPGHWLLDVQGHGEFVDEEVIDGVTYKRESGQLLLMKIPGS